MSVLYMFIRFVRGQYGSRNNSFPKTVFSTYDCRFPVIGYPLLKLRIAAAHLLFPIASQNIDVAVLGYPKTGNTWFSMQLRKLLIGHYGLSDECLKNIMPESIRGLLTHRNSNVPTIFVTPQHYLISIEKMQSG